MPTFSLETEQGRWLANMRLNVYTWKAVTGSRAAGTRSRWLRCVRPATR